MNSKQKIVQQQFLNNEQAIIKRLYKLYQQALKDIEAAIAAHYKAIQAITDEINALDPKDPMVAILESRRRSKVYQKTYQEQLKKQVSAILDKMKLQQYTTVSGYLDDCYNEGYLGAMYDLHGQGIPIIQPIDQQKLVHAVQLESKISKGLYTKLGADIDGLKAAIRSQVSRSMATGTSFADCARQLADQTNIGFNRSIRIARTEGHRIQTTAAMDAMTDAKDKGADVLKQWDSTLDGRTRESHRMVDGEIRELNEKFSNGLDYPGVGGPASEVVNCRCALLQRARWALDDDELQVLKDRAEKFGLDKTKNFDDFKKKYLKASESLTDDTKGDIIPPNKGDLVVSPDMKQCFEEYARGEYEYYCAYSQALVTQSGDDLAKAVADIDYWKNGSYIQTIGLDTAKARTVEMMRLIDGQDLSDIPLYRIESFRGTMPKQGDLLEWGIRSTSRDSTFADKVLKGLDKGLSSEFEELTHRPIVYEILGQKRHFDIAPFSPYDQQESLVFGKFKVLDIIQPSRQGTISKQTFDEAVQSYPDLFKFFTSKKGTPMVEYNGKTFPVGSAKHWTFYNGTKDNWSLIAQYEEEQKELARRPIKVVIEQIT